MQALRLIWGRRERQGLEQALGSKEEQERGRWSQRVNREWVSLKGEETEAGLAQDSLWVWDCYHLLLTGKEMEVGASPLLRGWAGI